MSPKSWVRCMVYFRARTYKKFFRVRVPIQPQKEVRWNEKSSWIGADDNSRLGSSIPTVCSMAFGCPNGLRTAPRFLKRQRSYTPT